MKWISVFLSLFIAGKALSFTLSTSSGAAFDIEGRKKVVLNVEDGGGSCELGLTPTELLDLAMKAMDRFWNRAPTSGLKIIRGTVVDVPGFEADDLCNPDSPCSPTATFRHAHGLLLGCNENSSNFSSPAILGLSVPTRLSGKKIQSAAVLLNGSAGALFSTLDEAEQMAVIAHEIGHGLGLGHSPVSDSLMYYQSVPTRRNLGGDDLDGITYLYPKTQVVDLNCGSVLLAGGDRPGGKGPLTLLFLILALEFYRRSKHSA